MKRTDTAYVRAIMQRHGLHFDKSFGQNFLVDERVLSRILDASGVDEETGVIEIGPGIGTLTEALSLRAARVTALELDKRICAYLEEAFADADNISVIQGDALKADFEEIIRNLGTKKVSVVANLPYYITTPILMRLLEENLPLESITVMIQKEVAQRICASPGSAYGALSVAAQFYSSPEIVLRVPPGAFLPPPKVESSVVRLEIANHQRPQVKDEKLFFAVVKAAFGQRRKTLANALHGSGSFGQDKQAITEIVKKVCTNENIRGEALSLADFVRLADAFATLQ